MDRLKQAGVDNRVVLVGGAIPKAGAPQLKKICVTEVFPTGTPPASIIKFIQEKVKKG